MVVKHIHMPKKTAIEAAEAEKQWRTRIQIAQHLQISTRTIGNWMRRGILPYSKGGHLVRFELHRCDRAVERFRVESRPPMAREGHTRSWGTGQQVAMVKGRLRTETWNDDGTSRSQLILVCDSVQFVVPEPQPQNPSKPNDGDEREHATPPAGGEADGKPPF